MAEKKPITWITKNGKHIPIYDQASNDEKKKDREIAQNEKEKQLKAVHQYQQVSWEGLDASEKKALGDYISSNDDVKDRCSRGMQVNQADIDRWLKDGSISFEGMSSWSTDGAVAAQFAEVPRSVDAEDGKRSVIIVSEDGLSNSAALPRTNSYKESEVLTSTKHYTITSSRVQRSVGENKSPTTTIIFVKEK